jgi:hypothetical protein
MRRRWAPGACLLLGLLGASPPAGEAALCTLSWDPPPLTAGLTGYWLYASAVPGVHPWADRVLIPLTALPDPAHPRWTGQCAPDRYWVVTAAYGSAVESQWSNEVRVTAQDLQSDAPPRLTGLVQEQVALPLPVVAVTASASTPPTTPTETRDGKLTTWWSAEGLGQWIQFDLGQPRELQALRLAWYVGATRQARYDVLISLDGQTWQRVATGPSSGTSTGFETVVLAPPFPPARYVRLVGQGNTLNTRISVTEVELLGR